MQGSGMKGYVSKSDKDKQIPIKNFRQTKHLLLRNGKEVGKCSAMVIERVSEQKVKDVRKKS